MAKITITAGEGVQATATILKPEIRTREIPEVRDSLGNILAAGKSETFTSFAPSNIDHFASESRTYDLQPDQKIIVELTK